MSDQSNVAQMDLLYIDKVILASLNAFAQRSWTLDYFMTTLCGSDLFKGGLFIAILWWMWFVYADEAICRETRERVITVLLGAFIAVVLARALQITLPFRPRPMHHPELAFRLPYNVNISDLGGWSSFPSDHAALFVELAVGLFCFSFRLGVFGLSYFVVFIGIPRMYYGLHYPTDLMGGSILGVASVGLAHLPVFKNTIKKPILNWSQRHTPSFYVFFFLLSFQVATLFVSLRIMASFVGKFIIRVVLQYDVFAN
jgi:undecaprenyl-diphosphatase